MNPWFSAKGGSDLYGILAEIAGDIILKTDVDGFIEHVSPDLTELGVDLSALLIPPHIADLADPAHCAAVRSYFQDTCLGIAVRDRIEFPLPRLASDRLAQDDHGSTKRHSRRWFALRLRPVAASGEERGGAMGLLRGIEPRHAIDQYWSGDDLTDQLTGIVNRQTFCTAISEQLGAGTPGAVALFEIDAFRAQCLRLGRGSADAMIRAFAEYMGVVRRKGEVITRFDGPRFAVLIPRCGPDEALTRAKEIIATFTELSRNTGATPFPVSASAGLARLADSQDETFNRAERALILANAAGGSRAELYEMWPSYLTKGRKSGAQSPIGLL